MIDSNSRRSLVLVIEDDPIIREMAQDGLIAQDHEVMTAATGEDGIQLAHTALPDLIMLDVMMPGRDGFSVLEEIRNSSELADIPVILITSLVEKDFKLKAFAIGADDYITKPFDPDELAAKVTSITRRNRFRRLVDGRESYSALVNASKLTEGWLDRNGRFIEISPQLRKLLSLADDSPSGLAALLYPGDREALLEQLAQAFDDKRSLLELNTRLRRSDGEEIPVLMNLIPGYQGETLAIQMLIKEFPAYSKHVHLNRGVSHPTEDTATSTSDQVLDQICQQLLARLEETITLDEIVRLSGYSRRSIQYAFKRRFDLSPTKWVQEQRLNRAYERLKDATPDASIYDIMLGCGFSDHSEFGRLFKARFNQRPSDVLKGKA